MPTVPKSLLKRMLGRAEIARLLGLKPAAAERTLGYARPTDGNRQCVVAVTAKIPHLAEGVQAKSAPRS